MTAHVHPVLRLRIVELHLHSPHTSAWHSTGITLPFFFKYFHAHILMISFDADFDEMF
jgi:hypothetical protein